MENRNLSIQEFKEPGVEYRPVPFWGLTKTLKEEELLAQIREMKDKGWGGFFMHARYPLITPYLSDEYMDLMKKCVLEAKKLGLKAWIYDDSPWCSGSAGGLTAAGKKEYRSKALVLNLYHRLTPIDEEEAIAYFGMELNDKGLPGRIRRIQDPKQDKGKEHYFLHFYLFTEPLHSSYEPGFYDDCVVHGFAASDNLNPDAVKRYIDITYDRFYQEMPEEAGETLMGGFSDMPVYNWNYSTPHPSIPWTNGFDQYFRQQYGYDLIPHLPSLFFDVGENDDKIRCDYWKAASTLFSETYTRQLYEWCDEHGMLYSGHYWGEETLHWQIPWCGDVMQHFQYQHYVGMDHSIKSIEDPIGIKQASTAAEQLGKPRMMAESYGLSGNGLSYEQRKWIADWEYALGADFLIPYIAQSSLKGRAKRDEPASIFIQQPYWQHEKFLYDYYGRLSYALTRGHRVVNLLVLQPLETARTLYTASKYVSHCYRPDDTRFEAANAGLFAYNQDWMELCDQLLAWHRDFHIGNEELMEKFGNTEKGLLRIGEYRYPVVLVPPSRSWSSHTVNMLENFAANGGTIIAVEPVPFQIGGVPDEQVLPAATKIVSDFHGSLERELDLCLDKDIQMPECADILYQHRETGEEDIYFLANTSMEHTYLNMECWIEGTGHIEVWDSITGERFELAGRHEKGGLSFHLDFYPVSSYLLVRTNRETGKLKQYKALPTTFSNEIPLNAEWQIKTDDPNVLVLDYCDLQVGDTGWVMGIPIFKAQQTAQQGGAGSPYRQRFHFVLGEDCGPLYVVLEDPERISMQINDQQVLLSGHEWWVDPSFHVFEITEYVKSGRNQLEVSGIVGIDTELENYMILGQFSVVDKDGELVIKKRICLGKGEDLTREGYPFFTGHISLEQEVEVTDITGPAYLKIENVKAVMARIFVNEEYLGNLPWKPYIVEITGHLRPGLNKIRIELVTTRRNLFGPHHYKFKEEETFSVPARWVNEAYWMDEYYFSPLGVSGVSVCFRRAQ
ncbi:glycosyl hydrolase [Diplocloster hominis]|uniref:glycosyl hydrolase n=1 Tax=Diplocloster hominis TaxID=3079010 RepID=UPI0031BA57A0